MSAAPFGGWVRLAIGMTINLDHARRIAVNTDGTVIVEWSTGEHEVFGGMDAAAIIAATNGPKPFPPFTRMPPGKGIGQ